MFRVLFRVLYRGIFLVVVVLAAMVGYHFYRSGQLPFVKRTIEDVGVMASVKAALAIHRDLSSREIEVATDEGRVTLSGRVASDDERDVARTLVENVEGVVSVENALVVDPDLASTEEDVDDGGDITLGERVDDLALLTKIRTALHLDRQARKLEIEIDVSAGDVQIRGEVPSTELAERVRTLVAGVAGVQSLDAAGLVAH